MSFRGVIAYKFECGLVADKLIVVIPIVIGVDLNWDFPFNSLIYTKHFLRINTVYFEMCPSLLDD